MKPRVFLQTIVLTAVVCNPSALANPFHPEFGLLNSEGDTWQPRQAVSQWHTCGQCHAAEAIGETLEEHHRLQPEMRPGLEEWLTTQPVTSSNSAQTDCLTCHNQEANERLETYANNDGKVRGDVLQLTSPGSEACGSCHGLVNVTDNTPLVLPPLNHEAHFGITGEIFSGQRISASALNIDNKQHLNTSFDIHAERVVGCTDCHASPNNPKHPQKTQSSSQHGALKYDPRTLSAHDYLQQPDHSFDKAHSCTTCHETQNTHKWLPFFEQHINKLSCEACHTPWLPSPALSAFNSNTQETQWRGLQDSLITGYIPWLLPNENGRLIPVNIIEHTQTANNISSAQFIARPIHHGIQNSRATKQCRTCHSNTSLLLRPLPGSPANWTLPEQFLNNDSRPRLAESNIYVLGGNTVPWVDWLGLATVVLTALGVGLHGGARFVASKKLGSHSAPRKRVYMYTRYERIWHWLQAAAILLLLATGAAIHKPWLFSWLSFRWMVEVHNITGFILLINAALALFYHLASGEIKQYIPMPNDVFVRMFEQVHFYLKGIFNNAPHPFEKNREHKLNPLQKIAYFGLLNLLLPLQMVTGLLMWGAQTWPQLADTAGGLVFLGPLHSLLAWLFVSFLIMHIYLTTTSGPRALSGIKAMVDGWEMVEIPEEKHRHE